ncbi:MAG: 2Fe-2S iron-sulfur cluster-binding protein [Hydrogenophaga sp.]|jgi:ferredoxin|uniref:2Fe-2S iron-sulfur cluster-binding protein n=1 Tax=Hydrogenophaga sp. TaxID=1904254 RepID=UPI001DE75DDE|nr:2Fe-2S iron-sulfur cluster-binding protein [Hydrogenophaga sp.]MBW0169923.1 2Fe-2S iron-sulfur cluster binding domain-containing protein [Hydrogenophaga sp.]MBW0183062.1 2Fe-2S iron-sulfur cluster binding domain-containing protein [Hydrogenophaga sp.]
MPTFRIRVDGQVTEGEADSETSLFAALSRAGIAWPVSCRNGTCRTCIARLLQGRVRYDIAWPGLSAEEKEEGYCLPCIARPLADVVITRG